jgi:hypothetical protein
MIRRVVSTEATRIAVQASRIDAKQPTYRLLTRSCRSEECNDANVILLKNLKFFNVPLGAFRPIRPTNLHIPPSSRSGSVLAFRH